MSSSLPVDPVFQLILEVPGRAPSPALPGRLTGLFRELAKTDPVRPVEEIEDQIWTLWSSHTDRVAEETLAEPRHFGAISGFGNVCLRNGHLNEARAAFQIALSINPHMEELRDMLENLSPHNLMLH